MSDIYFTSAPDQKEAYKVGDRVEVYCDHEDKEGNRVRDWLTGTVVQVDSKMIAVQFEENVYLTDGWMVPDHVRQCFEKFKDKSNNTFIKMFKILKIITEIVSKIKEILTK